INWSGVNVPWLKFVVVTEWVTVAGQFWFGGVETLETEISSMLVPSTAKTWVESKLEAIFSGVAGRPAIEGRTWLLLQVAYASTSLAAAPPATYPREPCVRKMTSLAVPVAETLRMSGGPSGVE